MIEKITFLSAKKMAVVVPSETTIVVSILDESDAHCRPPLHDFADHLNLDFADWAEEFMNVEIGSVEDDPIEQVHMQHAMANGEKLPTLADAKRIVDFVHKFNDSPCSFDLVIHCHGGISRSAAVALWAAGRFRAPITNEDDTDRANPRVLRLLFKAEEQLRMTQRSVFVQPR